MPANGCRHVGVIAAYRDQHKVTTDDPRQVLGPYAEPGHAGHRAYWHAAESVLAARRLAGLEPAERHIGGRPGTRADSPPTSTVASPIDERAAIAAAVAAAPGTIWLGDPAEPRRARRRPARLRAATDRALTATRAPHGRQ